MHRDLSGWIQKKFNETLDRIGVWAIYTRSDPRFRCLVCHDLDTGDSRPNCESCFGTGYRVTLERWKVIYVQGLRRPASAEVPLNYPGWLTENQPFLVTRKTEIPRIGDLLFLVEWDRPRDLVPSQQGRPVRLLHTARILFPDPQIAGDVCYWLSSCQIVTEANRQFEPLLLRSPLTITRT